MSYFPDLSAYTYLHEDIVGEGRGRISYRPRYERRNVGWLDAAHPFERGAVPEGFADALRGIIGNPTVNQTRGFHECELCPPGAEDVAVPGRGGGSSRASFEIRVPGAGGSMFAAPVMVWHYVTAHEYRPPVQFVEAVRQYDAGWAADGSPWIPADAEHS
ncbi:hypothetical protein [Dactylosporangium sp. NPDC051541]|uniref:DUF7919 family protein n=1 Tax=Dactylosporangium sp. NPDC051541 TaxID=3363977 RepID=UPI00378E1A2F